MADRTAVALVCLIAGGVIGGLAAQWFLSSPRSSAEAVVRDAPERDSRAKPESSIRDREKGFSDSSSTSPEPFDAIQSVHTLAETATIRSEFLQSAALYRLAAPLDANGIRALIEEAETALSGGDYLGGTSLLIGRYAELDFASAVSYALENAGSSLERWLTAIFHARARIDVDEALAEALLLNTRQQRIAGIAILRSNDYLSAAQRRAVIETLNVPDQMAAVSQHNSQDAWNELRNISNPMQRMSAQSQVLMRWGQSDPWAALQASEEIDNAQMRQAIQGPLLALAAADDTQRVMDWINAQPKSGIRSQLSKAIIGQLGATDPERAEPFLAALSPADRVEAELGLWSTRAASDPEGAAAWVESLARSGDPAANNGMNQAASSQILMMLGMASIESAERFMEALPAARRTELEPSFVRLLAQNDPQSAVSRIARIDDEQQRLSASMSLVRSWSRNDPEAASRWVGRQSGAGTEQLYQALGSSWARVDIAAAREYALDMSAGKGRDHMFFSMLSSGRIEPDVAASIIEQIDDNQLRASAEKMRQGYLDALSNARGAAIEAMGLN